MKYLLLFGCLMMATSLAQSQELTLEKAVQLAGTRRGGVSGGGYGSVRSVAS